MTRASLALILTSALGVIVGSVIACGSEPSSGTFAQAASGVASATPADSVAAATAPPAQKTPAPAKIPVTINVVTTSNILADWVDEVGRDRVEVFSLAPVNSDLHTFQPGARDISRIADAGLVLSVGLSLEAGWMNKVLESAARDPSDVVSLGDAVAPLENIELYAQGEDEAEGEHARERDDEEGHGPFDPHFWFDPLRVKLAVTDVAARLSALDPANGDVYRDNAAAYNHELDELHHWIETQVALIPVEHRLLVTSHDSFRYFTDRYGFETVGTVLPGVTTEREPTAQELSRLVEDIREYGAPAVFGESVHSSRLAHRIAEETGVALVGSLYTASLGPKGGEAGSYLDLMRYNVKTIVEALK